jgi:hypothetical protein
MRAGEKERKEQKHDMKKSDRAKMAAAKPLMRQSNNGCQLHVKVRRK